MEDKKKLIIKHYKETKRILSKKEISLNYLSEKKSQDGSHEVFFISLKSPSESCGDEIDFLVWKKNSEIKKINFSNEDCCIITAAAANLVSDYLEKNCFSRKELDSFIDNIEKMINGKHYNKDRIKDFDCFSGIENIYSRNECIKIVTNFVRKVFNING